MEDLFWNKGGLMAGTKIGGLKAAQKNLASNPNFYAEIGRKGGSATFASHGSYKGFAQDIILNATAT